MTLLQHAQKNDQKHSLYLHVSGGKNAIEKCLWYYLAFRFHRGKAIMKKISELEGELRTKSSFQTTPELVPRYEVDKSHKTLGCWVCPSMCQKRQKQDLMQKCESWVKQVATSHLKPHEKLMSYDTVLERQLEYRLATACFFTRGLQRNYEDIQKSIV